MMKVALQPRTGHRISLARRKHLAMVRCEANSPAQYAKRFKNLQQAKRFSEDAITVQTAIGQGSFGEVFQVGSSAPQIRFAMLASGFLLHRSHPQREFLTMHR
jgi:hypothetical protein